MLYAELSLSLDLGTEGLGVCSLLSKSPRKESLSGDMWRELSWGQGLTSSEPVKGMCCASHSSYKLSVGLELLIERQDVC